MSTEEFLSAKGYSENEERRILDVLGRSLLTDYPNRTREGARPKGFSNESRRTRCLSQKRRGGSTTDHLSSCSPCYTDFLASGLTAKDSMSWRSVCNKCRLTVSRRWDLFRE
jgi:hypothetical protein